VGRGPVSFPLGMKPDEYGLTGRRQLMPWHKCRLTICIIKLMDCELQGKHKVLLCTVHHDTQNTGLALQHISLATTQTRHFN